MTTEAELIYLDDTVFEIKEAADSESESVEALTTIDPAGARHSSSELGSALAVAALQCCSSNSNCSQISQMTQIYDPEARYNGVLYAD